MAALGDWITPRVDGVRYFDDPPLLDWLTSGSFAVAGTTPAAARLWPALAAGGVAPGPARPGGVVGGPRGGPPPGPLGGPKPRRVLSRRLLQPGPPFLPLLPPARGGVAVA